MGTRAAGRARAAGLFAAGLCAALVCALVAGQAAATVVRIPPLEEMTHGSDVVVHARVVDQLVAREDGRVVTRTTLEVIEGVKGQKAGDLVVVFQVGGTLDGATSWITGAHRFQLHDEVVLFGVRKTQGAATGEIVSYGIGVGVFEVVRDAAGAKAVERIGDVVVATKDGRFEAPAPRAPVALNVFLADLRRVVDAPRPKLDTKKLRVLKAPTEVRR